MRAIETTFDGRRFRSRIEARWAVFFTRAGIEFLYEPDGYVERGAPYLPDFFLPVQDYFIEVKGTVPTTDERDKADGLSELTCKPVFIAYGDIPLPPNYPKPMSAEVHIARPDGGTITMDSYCWCECPDCGYIEHTDRGKLFSMRHHPGCSTVSEAEYGDDSPRLLAAYAAARGARFEHGERTSTQRFTDDVTRTP
jgi:hypothetical protein